MSQKRIINQVLRPENQNRKMVASWLALSFGLFLLLVAVLSWLNFQQILNGKNQEDSMSEYLVVGKTIEQSVNSQHSANSFSDLEMKELETLKNVEELGKLTANQFPVRAHIGGNLGFQTELFLESVNNSFLDKRPPNWEWQPGQTNLPVILSNDFLNLYNYGFALSQGFPQLSQKSIQSLPFQIVIADGRDKFNVEIVGFTDRISSILVPERFLAEMNKKYHPGPSLPPARIILKVKDPSEKAFVSILKEKGYTVNSDQLRWSRVRSAVQAIISVVGGVAVLIVGMGILSFLLFLEITIYKAAKEIQLLKQLGYAPQTLRKMLLRFFLPWLSSAVIFASVLAFGYQLFLNRWLQANELNLGLSNLWILPVFLFIFILMLIFFLNKSSQQILKKV